MSHDATCTHCGRRWRAFLGGSAITHPPLAMIAALGVLSATTTVTFAAEPMPVLPPSSFVPHIARFNAMEDENVTNHVPNAQSFDWLAANIPRLECPDREVVEIYIGEYLDETTGQWLKGRQERSRYYNHSTYADLLITGVIGLRPRVDDVVEVHPLLPTGLWDWFCLDGVTYHGRTLTILWDRDGSRYQRGAGLRVFTDGKPVAQAANLERITGRLP